MAPPSSGCRRVRATLRPHHHSSIDTEVVISSHLLLALMLAVLTMLVDAAAAAASRQQETLISSQNNQQQQQQQQQQLPSPIINKQPQQLVPMVGLAEGPGVDLVALNWRRFELDHRHLAAGGDLGESASSSSSWDDQEQLKRGELIEAQIAAIPERLLASVPPELSKQLFESLSADPNLILGPSPPLMSTTSNLSADDATTDPDGASIERLTKSCLAVQASSLTPDQLNVTFHLFTRRNPRAPFLIRPQVSRQELLANPNCPLDPRLPIKWITHGFHTNLDKSEWMLEARDKILAHEPANVILTDWRRGASPALAFYPKAAANAHVVARMIVKILRRLGPDINLSQVHLIGHSLGAHIMGFVGSAFTEEYLHKTQQTLARMEAAKGKPLGLGGGATAIDNNENNQLIGRITACDPALPCFGPSSKMSGALPMANARVRPHRVVTSSRRFKRQQQQQQQQSLLTDDWTPAMWTHLRPDSAILVEVMHSNPGVMGYAEPLGDYDFFPNGSDRQPGCSGSSVVEPPPSPGVDGRAMSRTPTGVRRDSRRAEGFLKGFDGTGVRTRLNKRNVVTSLMKNFVDQNQQRITALVTNTAGNPQFWQSQQGGDLIKSLSSFIKPIRDFFQAYTCSHHRAVDYMVESMYYDLIAPQDRLQPERMCQMVGYLCQDYASFKRGHCFNCHNELECRSFGQSTNSIKTKSSTRRAFEMQRLTKQKRILPTLSQYTQNYKAQQRNQYYFDTKAAPNYCLHHYHLLVKYRWFRIRDSVSIDRLRLTGSLNELLLGANQQSLTFNKFTHHTYTMLLTHADFLGQIETLLVYGTADSERLKTQYIEYIDVTYMSNIDPQVRSINSARLCRAQAGQQLNSEMAHLLGLTGIANQQWTGISVFARCNQENLLYRS